MTSANRSRSKSALLGRILTCLLAFGLLVSAVFAADLADLAETRKKAEQGDADAQFNLGLMYDSGNGVPKDLVQAHMWWNIAGAKRHENANKNLADVEKEMTPEQKAEATKLARELFERLSKQ